MFLSDISIKRPIMMSMFLIVFLLFGGIAYLGMPLDLTPDVDIPYVTIQTVYPGSGPKEIETQITKKIEDAVSSVSKIELMTSYSMEGVSLIILKFELDKDVNIANQEIKDKVDKIINELPADADLPIVEKFNIQEIPVVDVILTGDLSPTELWDIADKKIKDRFSQIEGVARAVVVGGQEREIQVVLSDRTIFQNKINLSQLAGIIGANNLDLPGGSFKQKSQEYTVRSSGEYKSLKELSDTEVPTLFGNKKLGDIAEIKDVGAEVRERTSFFNNINKTQNSNIVLFSLIKNSEGNTVDIAKAIYKLVPELEASLPAGLKLDIVNDNSVFIKSTVDDTISTIILGILLTGLVMLLFLHDVRSTIIVALAMPMSILSAFLFMGMFGFTKNIMSLMGLSTAIGILVSNSVIVIENIFRHKRMGANNAKAASVGTSEVVVAVLAATATNIAVFLPVANMSSMVGQFFKEFALTVTFATLFSLIISFTLTPMMASLILSENNENKKKKRGIGDFIEDRLSGLESWYKKMLSALLKGKKRSVAVLLISLIALVGSFSIAGNIGFEFFPFVDEGDISIKVELPNGYELEQTAAIIQLIEGRLKEDENVKHILTRLGKVSDIDKGTNMSLMGIKLVDINERIVTTEQVANDFIKKLSDIPNIKFRARAISSMGGPDRAPIMFYLKGQETAELEKIKNNILDKVKTVPGIINLNTTSRSGKPEISIFPNRKKISDAGLTIYDIAIQLRGVLTGLVATQYRDDGEEYDIRILTDDASFDTPEKLGKLSVFGNGRSYTLSQLADLKFTEGFSTIMHIDKYKAIQFTAATAPGVSMGTVMDEIDVYLDELILPSGYKIDWGGDAEMMNKTIVDMLSALILAFILTYMLLAGILENLVQPLLVLGTFPLALMGVIFAMLITGSTMNVISMMAIVMLLGIVVNNAILILDYVNVLVREQGKSIREALIEAAPVKMRPILMSSIAIILGMMPMALGMGDAGREMRQPMGIISIGGLIVSTLLTLVVIPSVYNIFSRSKKTQKIDKGISNA
ncbi:MAG: efflux RND transporter permease subunit [candidate division Zixibacteria bacterium]|nr:efflux RND transporter permease subunit [candidate division Zixibacteria bacterium]